MKNVKERAKQLLNDQDSDAIEKVLTRLDKAERLLESVKTAEFVSMSDYDEIVEFLDND